MEIIEDLISSNDESMVKKGKLIRDTKYPNKIKLLPDVGAPEKLLDIPNAAPQNHPHNFYLQMWVETGWPGLVVGTVFLFSIIWNCFLISIKNRHNVIVATFWVIPLGLFWPIATSGDFFGQWNNIFVWSAVALAVSADNLCDPE